MAPRPPLRARPGEARGRFRGDRIPSPRGAGRSQTMRHIARRGPHARSVGTRRHSGGSAGRYRGRRSSGSGAPRPRGHRVALARCAVLTGPRCVPWRGLLGTNAVGHRAPVFRHPGGIDRRRHRPRVSVGGAQERAASREDLDLGVIVVQHVVGAGAEWHHVVHTEGELPRLEGGAGLGAADEARGRRGRSMITPRPRQQSGNSTCGRIGADGEGRAAPAEVRALVVCAQSPHRVVQRRLEQLLHLRQVVLHVDHE
jgi:hypothetical protein